jgi:hypothetical protein
MITLDPTIRENGRAHRTGGISSRARRACVAIALLLPHTTGCFHYVPAAPATLPAGAEVSVGVTDGGRTALAETVGPDVLRIAGTVVESTDMALVLSVQSVAFAQLPVPAQWAGERVEISRDLLSDVRQRRISTTRTAVMAGIVTAAAVAVSFLGLRGFGTDPGGGESGGPPLQQ